ncbi:MAG: alpha-glucan family phosphorylase [bacterium]
MNLPSPNHRPLAERLIDLSKNLWWTWNPQAQEIFHELSPLVWERSNHNACEVLTEISRAELKARLHEPDFARKVRTVLDEFESYLNEEITWASQFSPRLKNPVAYFSAEFGLHESLPIYSGGLGVLSGDHTKSASDLGIPFIGISLFYRNGYFQQRLGPDGWQQEHYPVFHPDRSPLELVTNIDGSPLLNAVEIGHSIVRFQAWKLRVGRAILYLLDTNLPENEHHFQGLTANVYGGNIDTRIGQEIVLGIGGVRLLRSLGIEPSVYHMNEGHSAFLTLELLQEELRSGKTKPESELTVTAQCIFTTHTPVAAGHDRFSPEMIHHLLGNFWSKTGLTFEELMTYGRVHPQEPSEQFTMTVLALKMSRAANGVSELHGQVSREMWRDLYPSLAVEDVPIGHVTNGVHTPSWAIGKAHEFWNKRLGIDWTSKLMDTKFWHGIEVNGLATDEELWALRYELRRLLIEFVRHRKRDEYLRSGHESLSTLEQLLSPDALTICFARRFATYKRATLLFRHLEEIIPLFTDPQRPVQMTFSGKAHPRDNEGKRFLQLIWEFTHHPQLQGKVVFLENYDMNVARHLVAGADLWLNTPRRPLEASGTSGQKILIHGGLNLSMLDGWWPEAYNGSNGWSIGDESRQHDIDFQDDKDFQSLIRVLKEKIIPEFYLRNDHGIPVQWLKRVRHSMRTLIPVYNTNRMIAEYVKKYYCKL